MRLLYLVPPARRGGVARSVARVAGELRARHQVLLLRPDLELFPGEVEQTADQRCFGVTEPFDLAAWQPFVAGAIADWRPDVVVGYYGTSAGVVAVRAATAAGLPSLVCLRGNDVDRDLERPDRRPLLAEAVLGAGAVTAVSREMAARVDQALGRGPGFVTNSVDRTQFAPAPVAARALRRELGLSGDRPVLGIFGELKPKRGLDRLAAIRPELSRWQLLVVGTVRAAVRDQLDPSWRQLPYLDDLDQLRAAYGACDAVVQPSWRDGMPNVVLEAMACERTVLAAAVGGLPDLIAHGETGLLFDDADQLARQLAGLRARPRPELGRAARAAVPAPADEAAAFESIFASLRARSPAFAHLRARAPAASSVYNAGHEGDHRHSHRRR